MISCPVGRRGRSSWGGRRAGLGPRYEKWSYVVLCFSEFALDEDFLDDLLARGHDQVAMSLQRSGPSRPNREEQCGRGGCPLSVTSPSTSRSFVSKRNTDLQINLLFSVRVT